MAKRLPTAGEITAALDEWAQPQFAEPYDNVGLHVGSAQRTVDCALVALDLTPEVVDEAEHIQADLIITHHPLLFHAQKRILDSEYIGNLILRLARLQIAALSVHTNLDSVKGGVSTQLASLLDLTHIRFLQDRDESGMGALGELSRAEPLEAFLDRVSERLATPALRFVGDQCAPVQRVAVCGGAGGGLIQDALRADADVFVSADLSYHRFFEVLAPNGTCRMALVDAGHYETERHAESILCEWLARTFPEVRAVRTSVRTSPIHAYINRTYAS